MGLGFGKMNWDFGILWCGIYLHTKIGIWDLGLGFGKMIWDLGKWFGVWENDLGFGKMIWDWDLGFSWDLGIGI